MCLNVLENRKENGRVNVTLYVAYRNFEVVFFILIDEDIGECSKR